MQPSTPHTTWIMVASRDQYCLVYLLLYRCTRVLHQVVMEYRFAAHLIYRHPEMLQVTRVIVIHCVIEAFVPCSCVDICSVTKRIRKRTNIVITFTQEYSRVLYPLRNLSILSKVRIHPRTPHY